MNKLNQIINKIVILLLFFTVSCTTSVDSSIEFDKKKAGGLYETLDTGEEFQFYNSTDVYDLNVESHISFRNFETILRQEENDYGTQGLLLKLDPKGANLFREMTSRNLGEQLCFVINDKVVAAPIVNAVIEDGSIAMDLGMDGSLEDIIKLLEE